MGTVRAKDIEARNGWGTFLKVMLVVAPIGITVHLSMTAWCAGELVELHHIPVKLEQVRAAHGRLADMVNELQRDLAVAKLLPEAPAWLDQRLRAIEGNIANLKDDVATITRPRKE